MDIYNQLIEKKESLAVIGLGYVGLPIALEFAKKVHVIGFDINAQRIDLMRKGIDPSNELEASDFEDRDIYFTSDPEDLKKARFFIVAVPTPIDQFNQPDLKPLVSASRTVGAALKKGDYVVFESTVYPGCTEEDCIPVMEELSGLRFKEDFKVGYSPERINPGDKEHTLPNIVKVVSGCCPESLEQIAKVYELVVKAGVHRASCIKVAEAAKIIENTQRDLNIALMNELSVIFNRMGINTYEVLEAAGTKWNFLRFSPGLVGGHCIGVDPYYLTHKSAQMGYHAKVITSGREINDYMGAHVARQVIKKVIACGKDLKKARILVMGATFKENVTDIRNSKIKDVVDELLAYSCEVVVTDPYADPEEVKHEYGFSIVTEPSGHFDAVIVAVPHQPYTELEEAYFERLMPNQGILADLKGLYRGKIKNLQYWTL